jgi:hypothetical protein
MLPKPLTSAQIRAARALIRWSAQQLADASAVGVTTIRRAELTASETKLTRVNDQAVRRTLEAAGVEFIDAEGGGPGVRLRLSRKRQLGLCIERLAPRARSVLGDGCPTEGKPVIAVNRLLVRHQKLLVT